jgi:E3 Ubiquitin ligase
MGEDVKSFRILRRNLDDRKNSAFALPDTITNVRPTLPFLLRRQFPALTLALGSAYLEPRFETSTVMLTLASSNPPSPGGFIVWCAIGFAGGIYLFFRGFYLLQRRHLILDTPFSKIRSAAMGMVEVSGLAVGPYTMMAPVTGRACYYYRTVAWEWKREGKNNQWMKVAGECMHLPFFLDDNTGRVLVDPRGAELDLHRDFQEEFNTSFFSRNETPASVDSFLARHGVATCNRIKIEECCIKPKNALFILGTLGDNPGIEVKADVVPDPDALDQVSARRFSLSSALPIPRFSLSAGSSLWFSSGASSYRDSSSNSFDNDLNTFAARTLASQPTAANPPGMRLSPGSVAPLADPAQPQKVADALRRAGITNPVAWSAAGLGGTAVKMSPDPTFAGSKSAAAANPSNTGAAMPVPGQADAFDPHPPVVLMKGQNNKTFLISWRGQREVARSLGWQCTLMIWGGPALALLSLYGLLSLLNWL